MIQLTSPFKVMHDYDGMRLFLLMILVSSAPTNVMAVQNGPTSIRVTWSPSNDATGYIISYYNSSSSDRVNISDGSTNEQLLTGLQNGGTYIISIVATSEHFFSDNVTVDFVHLGNKHNTCIVERMFISGNSHIYS